MDYFKIKSETQGYFKDESIRKNIRRKKWNEIIQSIF